VNLFTIFNAVPMVVVWN